MNRPEDLPGLPGKPVVGSPGIGITLRVVRGPTGLVCTTGPGTVWFLRAGLGLFGPGLLVVLLLRPEGFQRIPWLFYLPLWVLVLLTCFAFVMKLLESPRIEVPYASGDVLLFKRRTGEPARRLRRDDIDCFELGKVVYRGSEGLEQDNFVLWASLGSAGRLLLCVSDHEAQVRAFLDELTKITGRPSRVAGE